MFSNLALSAIAFLIALGILISFHEFGHFWVARRVGIKVLRFSIGFGRPIWRRRGQIDDTEFVIAAIPLGGYVKMLDEREASVAPEEVHRAFNRQSLRARTAVVIAGPAANFLLAIVAYWFVLMVGISGVAPLIGQIAQGSAADQAGFEYEDRILAVDERATPTWTDARIALLDASLGADHVVEVTVETRNGEQRVRELTVTQDDMLNAEGDAVAQLGFSAWWPEVEPLIGEVVPDSPADRAGLLPGDRVISVDEQPIGSWRAFVAAIQPRPGDTLEVVVERDASTATVSITPESVLQGDTAVGRIGVVETQSAALAERARVVVRYPVLEALLRAVERTWDMSSLTLRMLGKLITGQASLDNISGPISIAQFAGQSAAVGIDHYVNFLALISISLAVLNLLPIPMLDGGHLLYFAIEAVRGRPISEHAQMLGQQLGLIVLGGLMFLAFYNDLWRLMQ